MARPLRLEFEGALWHVTARGNERKRIVRDEEDSATFVRILASVTSRFGWILHGWVLMPNHYHLLVETPQPTLSRGMRQLGGVYTQAFNRRWSRCGHLFQGRFFSLHVERQSHLLELIRYTVLNPVRARLVTHPAKWRWSSYRATSGIEKPPPWLETAWTLAHFSGRGAPQREFERFVAEGSDYDPWTLVRNQVFLGDEDFTSKMRSRATTLRRISGVPTRQLRVGALPFERAVERVARLLRARGKDRRTREDRALAALFLRDAALATYSQIGKAFGLTMWGARSLVDRARKLTGGGDARRRYGSLLQSVEHKKQN